MFLANAAIVESRRLASGIAAASSLFHDQFMRVRPALQTVRPRFAELEKCLVRYRLQIADLRFVSNGADGAAAKAIAGHSLEFTRDATAENRASR